MLLARWIGFLNQATSRFPDHSLAPCSQHLAQPPTWRRQWPDSRQQLFPLWAAALDELLFSPLIFMGNLPSPGLIRMGGLQ